MAIQNRQLFIPTSQLYSGSLCYDCLIFSEQNETIDVLIQGLSISFLFQDEGDNNAFLGIQITKDKATKIIMLG